MHINDAQLSGALDPPHQQHSHRKCPKGLGCSPASKCIGICDERSCAPLAIPKPYITLFF